MLNLDDDDKTDNEFVDIDLDHGLLGSHVTLSRSAARKTWTKFSFPYTPASVDKILFSVHARKTWTKFSFPYKPWVSGKYI